MKITIVQGAFFPVPPLLGGAVGKVWFQLGKAFAVKGHDVHDISRQYEGLANEEIVDGVFYQRVKGYDSPSSIVRLKLLDLFYSLRCLRVLPKSDVIVTNTFWLPMLLRNEKYGKVYVHVARYPKGQMGCYRHVSRLQTVTSPIAKAIIKEKAEVEPKVSVVPYPIEIKKSKEAVRKAIEQKKNTILYVGRVHPEKGLKLLIEAFERFAHQSDEQWRLRIVGPWEYSQGGGGEEYKCSLLTGLSDQVEFVGPIFDLERLYKEYEEASLFVYPSLAEKGETFGISPLEAMAAGTVSLVSDLDCFKDFICAEENGYIFNHRADDPVEELKHSFIRILSDKEKLEEMHTRAYESACDYSLDKVSDKYLDDFDKVITS